MVPPDLDNDSAVQVVTGDGFQVEPEFDQSEYPQWKTPLSLVDQMKARPQISEMIFPDWISEVDKHVMLIAGKQPVPWEHLCDTVSLKGQKEFAIMEQRRAEECSEVPSPDNDAIVDSALAVWSPSCVSVLKSCGKQYYPIAVTGSALDHVSRTFGLSRRFSICVRM
jgi:hypothetical protein